MRRRRGAAALIGLLAAAAACNAILDLQPPPAPDASILSPEASPEDATLDVAHRPDVAAPDAIGAEAGGTEASGDDGASLDAGLVEAAAPVCAALDAAVPAADAGASYHDLGPVVSEAGASPWEFFGVINVNAKAGPFAGATFDGRYVYFAPSSDGVVVRLDTSTPGAFRQVSSWAAFDAGKLAADGGGAVGGFSGAVFDGRYVYFVPHAIGTTVTSVVARFDTGGSFADPGAWTTFDASTLDGGAPSPRGFSGAATDGRAVYLVPSTSGVAPDGRVVRYAGGDGDGGTGAFQDAASWSTFDLTTTNPGAAGFSGAAFDGKFLYLVPFLNGGLGDNGFAGIASRYRVNGGFTTASSWTSLDLTTVNGEGVGFSGAAFDGRYVYFVPHSRTIALRLDTTSSQPSSPAAWSVKDLGRLAAFDGGTGGFGGAAFDGRFVYFVPSTPGFGTLVRYDILSTFGADCAWSSVDVSQASPLAAGYFGAVFDGEYLYLVPHNSGYVARFDARSPASLPDLPAFHGSFY